MTYQPNKDRPISHYWFTKIHNLIKTELLANPCLSVKEAIKLASTKYIQRLEDSYNGKGISTFQNNVSRYKHRVDPNISPIDFLDLRVESQEVGEIEIEPKFDRNPFEKLIKQNRKEI